MSWRPRLGSVVPALAAGALLFSACFDSDEKPVPLATTSSTGPAVTTAPMTSTTSGTTSSSSGEPDVKCRDAIDCVFACAGELPMQENPQEPDLTCFLECEEGLTVGEALDLFRLTECVTNECIDLGLCDVLVPTETTTGGSSSSGGSSSGGSTGGSSGTTGGPAQPENPCLDCILGRMLDENLGGECETLAMACES